MYTLVVQDIYEELLEEERDIDFSELEEQLNDLALNPININNTTFEQLSRVPFLSAQQIDDILMLVERQPLQSIYELRLLSSLADYELRNLMPFVVVGPADQKQPFYWRDLLHFAKNELDIRFDARQIEQNLPDPFYLSLKYKYQLRDKVRFGIVAERDSREPFYYPHKTYGADFYGGYLQVNDIGYVQRLVLGDFRASFGEGLVLNTSLRYGGKVAVLSQGGFSKEGIQAKTSAAEYDFLRGVGATLKFRDLSLTAIYSARKVDGRIKDDDTFTSVQKTGYHRTQNELEAKREVWQQIAAINLTYRHKQWQVGLTATENIFDHSLLPQNLYYNHNYFRGSRQFSTSLNYRWHYRRLSLSGEVATAQNTKWGIANITTFDYSPINDLRLVLLYRYYSPYFDNLLANAFGCSSRQNDEHGVYLGADIARLRHWKFQTYIDLFHYSGPKYGSRTPSNGIDGLLLATYSPSSVLSMQWKTRAREEKHKGKYTLRYLISLDRERWATKTIIEGNISTDHSDNTRPTLGGVVAETFTYRWRRIPLVINLRAEAFSTLNYDNRLYLYEDDVLYSFSIPMLYGSGGRWYATLRYRFNEHCSVYLKAAETIYSKAWVNKQNISNSVLTEVHSMLKVSF